MYKSILAWMAAICTWVMSKTGIFQQLYKDNQADFGVLCSMVVTISYSPTLAPFMLSGAIQPMSNIIRSLAKIAKPSNGFTIVDDIMVQKLLWDLSQGKTVSNPPILSDRRKKNKEAKLPTEGVETYYLTTPEGVVFTLGVKEKNDSGRYQTKNAQNFFATVPTHDAHKVQKIIDRIIEDQQQDTRQVHNSFGPFCGYYGIGKRLVLADETVYPGFDELLRKIDNWKNNHAQYSKYGGRGFNILLYGEPGTGKSSLAIAISNYLKSRFLCFVAVYSVEDEPNHLSCTNCKSNSKVRSPNVVVLDDLDLCCKNNRETEEKDDSEKKSHNNRLAMLMNYLDADYPCVTIISTNYPERLDPALLRAGRINHTMAMGKLPTTNCNAVARREFPEHPEDYPLAPMRLSVLCDNIRHSLGDYSTFLTNLNSHTDTQNEPRD